MNVSRSGFNSTSQAMPTQHSDSMHKSHHSEASANTSTQKSDTFERSSQIPELKHYGQTGKIAK